MSFFSIIPPGAKNGELLVAALQALGISDTPTDTISAMKFGRALTWAYDDGNHDMHEVHNLEAEMSRVFYELAGNHTFLDVDAESIFNTCGDLVGAVALYRHGFWPRAVGDGRMVWSNAPQGRAAHRKAISFVGYEFDGIKLTKAKQPRP